MEGDVLEGNATLPPGQWRSGLDRAIPGAAPAIAGQRLAAGHEIAGSLAPFDRTGGVVHLITRASYAVGLDRAEHAEQQSEKEDLFHAFHGLSFLSRETSSLLEGCSPDWGASPWLE
jgi:hypothetical protein